MGERVVISTDDLRDLARRLKGGVGQLGEVKIDLVRVAADLADQPAVYSRLQQILAGIERLGSTISADHDQLAREVLELEAEEGVAPASSAKLEPASPSTPRAVPSPLSALLLVFLRQRFQPTATPPQPWDRQWVNPDGSMPPQASVAARAGFGSTWEARGSFGNGPFSGAGRASASAGGWVYGEAEAGRTGDGGYRASAQAGAGVGVSAHAEGQFDAGPVHAQGQANASAQASAQAGGSVQIGPDGVTAEASAQARASAEASASGEVGVDGVGSVGGQAGAVAGAEAAARGEVGVGADGLTVGAAAGAMAGASAGAGYSVDGPAGTQVEAGVSAKVGIGAEVDVSGEFGWDRVGFSLDAGIALGIGLGVSLDISFSPSDLVNALSPESLLGAVSDVVDTVGDVAEAVGDFFDPPGNPNELLDRPSAATATAPSDPGPSGVASPDPGSPDLVVRDSGPLDPGSPAGVSPDAADPAGLPKTVSDILAAGAAVGAEALPEGLMSLPPAELQDRVRSAVEDFLRLGGRTWS